MLVFCSIGTVGLLCQENICVFFQAPHLPVRAKIKIA